MPHLIERAATGRAKCRSCGEPIARDTWRVGEAVPNLFADKDGAEATHWYHPRCAAFRRPEAFLEAVAARAEPMDNFDALIAAARRGLAHHRLPRIDRAERAPTGRAACRACRVSIAKGQWRLSLLFWQDGRFAPAGFIHTTCARAYLGTIEILDRLRHARPDLTEADLDAIARDLEAGLPGDAADSAAD